MAAWGGSQSLSNREAAMPASHLRRICLMMGPGTLPSQGRDRMDLTQYNARLSGKPRLTPPRNGRRFSRDRQRAGHP